MALTVAQHALSERRACKLIGVERMSYRYGPRPDHNARLREALVEVARQKPRFGYRRLHAILERRGEGASPQRVYRLYRQQGLAVRRLRRKRLVRAAAGTPALTGANQEWAMDFVSDALANGRGIRVLTLIDAHTRECPALEVDAGFPSQRVTRVLERVIEGRGRPEAIRCDNGPEFTSRHFLAWCEQRQIRLTHIQPGRPMQNGRCESFNGRLRDECLNAHWFVNLADARHKIEHWRQEYNTDRPHSALAYRTPSEFAAVLEQAGRGKDGGCAALENPAGFPLSHRPAAAGIHQPIEPKAGDSPITTG